MVEPQIVVLDVAGSSPVGHPIPAQFLMIWLISRLTGKAPRAAFGGRTGRAEVTTQRGGAGGRYSSGGGLVRRAGSNSIGGRILHGHR